MHGRFNADTMRAKLVSKVRNWLEKKAAILMYHRVADLLFDPFELAVSPDHFEQQLQVLKKKFKVIAVNELVEQLQKKTISSNSVCITFDDGYSDNYTNAKSLLEKYHCYATFYIATEFMGKAQLFWWDELQHIILNIPKLPSVLSIPIKEELFEYRLGNNGQLTKEEWLKQKNWLFSDLPVTQRCELYVSLWKRLKPLPHVEQQNVLGKLKTWAGLFEPFGSENLPMTEQQLQAIANHFLFDIGIHTSTHPSLSLLNSNMQYREIAECKEYLEKKYSKRMQTLTYPYGDYNDVTLDIVKEQEIKGAFTTEERIVTKRTNPVGIGRFQVKNWTGREFQTQLSQWFKGR